MITKINDFGSFSLDDAEVGDPLMVTHGRSRPFRREAVSITRLGRTRITTSDGKQWMRQSHRVFGEGSFWDQPTLHFYDEDEIQESRCEQRKVDLVHKIQSTKFGSFELESLERISAAIDAERTP